MQFDSIIEDMEHHAAAPDPGGEAGANHDPPPVPLLLLHAIVLLHPAFVLHVAKSI